MLKPRRKNYVWSNSILVMLLIAGAMVGFTQPHRLIQGMLGQGGGAFLLTYVLGLFAFGVPMTMGWLYLGRRTDKPATTVIDAARESKLSRFWGWLGPLWQLLAFVLLAVLIGDLQGSGVAASVGSDALVQVGLLAVLVGLVWLIGAFSPLGLSRIGGVLIMLLILVAAASWVIAAREHTLGSSLIELFLFRFWLLGWGGVLDALQLALLTASLGGAALWTAGSYLPEKPASLLGWSLGLLLLTTVLSLLVGVGNFALNSVAWIHLNAYDMSQIPLLFAVLLTAALLTESVSVRLTARGVKRPLAWLLVLLVAGGVGVLQLLGYLPQGLGAVVQGWVLPVAVLLMAIFVGWMLKETKVRKTLAVKSFKAYLVTRALLRLFVPLVVIALLIHRVGLW